MRHRPGLTLIEALVVLFIIGIACALLIPAVQAARETARRTQCSQNLRQLGLAINAYSVQYGLLPQGSDGHGYSLHAEILPFLEQLALHNSINFTVNAYASYGKINLTVDRV